MAIIKRAISYIRFSDRKQAKGDSLRRQLEWGEALCRAKGWELDLSIKPDEGVSAFRGKNAATGHLAAFLQAVRQGEVAPGSVLLMECLDRLSREDIDPAWELFRSILKAGVEIYTREPDRHYLPADLNNFGTRIEVQAYMLRAYNESAVKSMRGKEYWRGKRSGLATKMKPIHKVLPAWLRLSPDKMAFEVIPEAAKAVRLIYQWAGEGLGLDMITARLNQLRIRPIGNNIRRTVIKDSWPRSYVAKLLQERTVVGEHQPHEMRDGKRVPVGDVIPNYFPQIISDKEWYAVREAIAARARTRGRTGPQVSSLFSGLIRDARDGHVMHLTYAGDSRKHNTRMLLSYGSRNGEPDSVRMPFPYDGFEQAFLQLVNELTADDLVGGKTGERDLELAALTGKRSELSDKIAALQDRIVGENVIDSLIPVLERLERDLKEADEKLEKIKAEAAHQQPAALDEVKALARLLRDAEGEKRVNLRLKARARIRQLVSEIWMLVWDVTPTIRGAEVQVFFHTGKVKVFVLNWVRRGRHRAHVFGGGGTVVPPNGELENGMDLRRYRADSAVRQRFTRRQAAAVPVVLEYMEAHDAYTTAAKATEAREAKKAKKTKKAS